jgi:hypothetical protein
MLDKSELFRAKSGDCGKIFFVLIDKNCAPQRLFRVYNTQMRQWLVRGVLCVPLGGSQLSAQEASPQEKPTYDRLGTPSRGASPKSLQLIQPQGAAGSAPGGTDQRMVGPGKPPEPFTESKAIMQPKNDKELVGAIKQLADELASKGAFSGMIRPAITRESYCAIAAHRWRCRWRRRSANG